MARGTQSGDEPSRALRAFFADAGFEELAYAAPSDASFRVGMAKLRADAASAAPLGTRLSHSRERAGCACAYVPGPA